MPRLNKLLIFTLVVLTSCASFNTQTDSNTNQNITTPKSELAQRFYLIGDAGNANFDQTTEPLKRTS